MSNFDLRTYGLDEALTLGDYDPKPYPLPEPQRGTRGPGEPVVEPWEDRAACKGQTDVMFPASSRKVGHWQWEHEAAKAKAICAGCPVVAECLDHALALPLELMRHGIRAGMDRAELERVRRERRRAA